MVKNPEIVIQNNPRKGYGQTGGGFSGGMITEPFAGLGLQLASNVVIKDGELHKMRGNKELAEITGADEIILCKEYEKSDGTFQTIVAYKSSTGPDKWKIRAIDPDGTIVVPTGGAGDVEFTTKDFGYVQITLFGYISNKTADATRLHSWDGTALTVVTGSPNNPEALGAQGRRLEVTAGGLASFSRSDLNPITSFTGGAGADTEGDYRVNSPGKPTAFLAAGTGTLIWFNTGSELHNVQETDDGTAVYNETRSKTYTYRGAGVTKPGHVTMGTGFAYALTSDGIIQVNPIDGTSKNLMDEDSGKIKDYWPTFDISNAEIVYSPKEKMIIATLSTDDTGINDFLVCYHEQTGAITLKGNSNFRSIGVINRQVTGGSSSNGSIRKVFDDSTYQNGDGVDSRFRVVSEWDTITNMTELKLPIDFFTFVNAIPDSTITINIYLDGDLTEPFRTYAFTVEDVTDTGSEISELGEYLLAIGDEDTDENSDKVTKDWLDSPFHSYCWEIIEESQNNFIIRDVILEYITLNEIAESKPFPSALFAV